MFGLILVTDYVAVIISLLLGLWIRNLIPLGYPEAFHVPPLYLYILIPTIYLIVLSSNNTHLRYVPTWRVKSIILCKILYNVLPVTH